MNALSRLAGVEVAWPWDESDTAVSEDEKAEATARLMERWG